MTRFHNFESTVTIVFQFYSMKGIERQIQINLSDFLPKKHMFLANRPNLEPTVMSPYNSSSASRIVLKKLGTIKDTNKRIEDMLVFYKNFYLNHIGPILVQFGS